MRASVFFGFFALTLLASATSATGCAIKDNAGNGQGGLLEFDAPAQALTFSVLQDQESAATRFSS